MRTRLAATALSLLTAIALAGALSACGAEEHEGESREGEPLEVAGLEYNVQITRFLNPDDVADAEYLEGQPPPEPGTSYLGVFLEIQNHSEEPRPSATNYVVTDTVDDEYELVEGESLYALDVGATVDAEDQLPLVNATPGAPTEQGALLIFLVDDRAADNRPLQLEIQTFGGTGEVTLDI